MQQWIKNNLSYVVLFSLSLISALLWFFSFKIKNDFDLNDVFFESFFLILVFICYTFIVKLEIKMLQYGWAIWLYALVLDLFDEFTKEPEFWDTTFPGTLESIAIVFIAIGFCQAMRKNDLELQKIQTAHDELDHIAHHDSLTSLPNRILFSDRLQQAMASAKRGDEMLAVHFVDLDNFKEINDTLGHHAGDQVLKEVAYRLRTSIRNTDTIARWGGDEFSMIQTNIKTITDAEFVANKVIEVLSERIDLGRQEVQVKVSIGIALYPLDSINFDELLIKADKAMYSAKNNAGSAFELFKESNT